MLQKKNPTDGKNAITHIGTVYYAKKAKPIDLPVGTIVKSPHGVMFEVDSCTQARDALQIHGLWDLSISFGIDS